MFLESTFECYLTVSYEIIIDLVVRFYEQKILMRKRTLYSYAAWNIFPSIVNKNNQTS